MPDPVYSIDPALQGTWIGYFENFTFPSTSDAIRLSLTQNPDGTNNVSVALGMGTPLPAPPTTPTEIWPPNWFSGAAGGGGGQPPASQYIEGFAYDAHDVRWNAKRVKFVINVDEPWQPWCQLQTSYYVKRAYGYRCIPGLEGGGAGPGGTIEPTYFAGDCITFNDDGKPEPVNCMQAYACGSNFVGGPICQCDCAGCAAAVDKTASFDITFTEQMAAGNVMMGPTTHDLVLNRAAPADGGQP